MPAIWYGKKGYPWRYRVIVSPGGYGVAAAGCGEYAAAEALFCTRWEARYMARACARAQVEPCHLRDVAEDWLVEIR